jgi:predicted esterase
VRAHRVHIYRSGRYFTLGEDARDEAWMVCHGYGQLAADFLHHFAPIEIPRRLIIAPEGLSRFYLRDRSAPGSNDRVGASWMTREDRDSEMSDYVSWLDTVYSDALTQAASASPRRLIALGFSQGCATVARWLARSAMLPASRCSRLILWGGKLPPELDLDAHREWLDGRLSLVAGANDEWMPAEAIDAYRRELAEKGIEATVEVFGGGHWIDTPTLLRLAGV